MSEMDQFGFSPDIGKYVRRDGKTYTEHGRVYDDADALFRTMYKEPGSHENYADWSEEKRAEVIAGAKAEEDAREAKRVAARAERLALAESAKAKLTAAEFDAVFDTGYLAGRGYE